jgi:signal transduction histidine kinase
MHLVRLVDDLYQLSLSDVGALTYRKAELDLTSVLEETVVNFRPKFFSKNIALEANYPESGVPFFGDSERLHQLFSNLLDNSIHYTDSGGQLQITLHVDSNSITIDFKIQLPMSLHWNWSTFLKDFTESNLLETDRLVELDWVSPSAKILSWLIVAASLHKHHR